jgi:MinD-like ATPase involved in chromosome partitioning or flagellar assembly
MLTGLIIGITPEVVGHVSDMCGQSADICVYKTLESYPNLHEIVRLINTYAPDVVFLQVWAPAENGVRPDRVREVAEEIRMARPETAIVALLPMADESGIRVAAELSIPEILVLPYKAPEFSNAIFRALDRSAGVVKGKVHSFLPAKSGNGATVTALNVAESLARDFHRRTLLIEADIGSGPIAVMLNIQPDQSVVDALESSGQLTDASWSRMVVKVNGLDVLASSGVKSAAQTSRFSYFRLLTFAQQHYDDIIVDFPGVVDEAADPLLSHSEAIYVVCTPELTSMALARRRLYYLERRGMPDRSLGVILNRHDQSEISKEQIEEMIGHKIVAQLPNDYKAVQEAVESGGFVDPDTELGKAYTNFAAKLVGLDPPQSPAASRLKSLLRKLSSAAAEQVPS